jgi:pantoate--beta-alanine ligase
MLPFQVIRTPAEMRALAEDQRRDGRRIGVVPTMGYLHEGHLSLLRAGRARSDLLVATIFVNPTQFGPGEDLDRYPRDEEGDLEKARAAGADLVFCPEAGAMYPDGYQTYVEVRELSRPLCGARRPVHFAGVASVVTKLFHLTWPHLAVFGQKDYQQLALIRRMSRDLDFGVEIVGCPIVREADGLAMSSRNAYLSAEERAQATSLSRGLADARERHDAGERDAGALLAAARAPIEDSPLARIEYVELRDAENLESLDRADRPAVLAMAVHFGKTRLIDNALLG